MPAQAPPPRDAAYQLLREILEDFAASGRRAVGANLKLELRRRSYGGFSEDRLGFSSFRRFLEAAEAEGIAHLRVQPDSDLEVYLPGATGSPVGLEPSAKTSSSPAAIRRDLWKAFVDWTAGWTRVYQVTEDRAVMFPTEPHPLERPEHTAYRDAMRVAPTAFRVIEPIGIERHLAWMKEFTASLKDAADRSPLEAALQTERPIAAFTRVARTSHVMFSRWHGFRVQRVADVIKSWASANDLEVSIFESADERAEENRAAPSSRPEDEFRKKLHALVDRLSTDDLNQIWVPLRYLAEL